MKYLKKYILFEGVSKETKLFESSSLDKENIESMLDYIEDIFLELKDEGFVLDYSGHLLTLCIYRPNVGGKYGNMPFKISEIAPTIKTMKNYLESVEFTPSYVEMSVGNRGNNRINYDELDIDSKDNITVFRIYFTNEEQNQNGAKLYIAPVR